MPIPNEARKAIYKRFRERIDDVELSCFDLRDPPTPNSWAGLLKKRGRP